MSERTIQEKFHVLEIGRSVHQRPGEYCCTYLNDYRIAGGKPWGGFISERLIKISDKDLQEALARAALHPKGERK